MNVAQKEELQTLVDNSPGRLLKAEALLKFAQNPATALHAVFTWDNHEAAEKYRLQEARQLIRAYIVYEPAIKRECRALVSVPTDRATGGGYRPTSDVLRNPIWLTQLVEDVRKRLTSLKESHAHLPQLDGLWHQLDDTINRYLEEMNNQAIAG